MNPYIDIPFYFIIAALFLIGWLKGFWRTILGPVSLALGVIVSYMYYFETHNFIISVVISIVAPFVFNFLFNYILGLMPKKKDTGEMSLFSFWSHLTGGLLHAGWHGVVILLIMFSIVILPLDFSPVRKLRTEIKNSLTYTHLLAWTKGYMPGGDSDIEQMAHILQNPDNVERMRGTPEYDALMGDNRVKNIIEDESLIEKIQKKDFMTVINNSKIKEIMQDPDLLKKFFKLQEKMISEAQENWQAAPKSVFNN